LHIWVAFFWLHYSREVFDGHAINDVIQPISVVAGQLKGIASIEKEIYVLYNE
jgi:hypothetical protein